MKPETDTWDDILSTLESLTKRTLTEMDNNRRVQAKNCMVLFEAGIKEQPPKK